VTVDPHFARLPPGGRRPIALLLRVPPPYGGGEILNALLRERLAEDPGYVVLARANPRGSKSNQGRLTWTNVRFAIRRIRAMGDVIRRQRPAVIYLSLPKNFAAFLWTSLVVVRARLSGVRVCGELAGMRFEFFDSPWKRAVGLLVLRRLHSIRFLGTGIRDAHGGYGFRNPVVIANGVAAPPSEPRPDAFARGARLELLYVGSLEESKGVATIVEAAALARQRGLDVRWTLMGEWASTAFRARMEALIRGRGLQEQVMLTGLVAGDARWEYFRRSHILVHPTRLDGQPLTILEAMSQGLAVISTRIGAIPETIVPGRNGILLDAASPGSLLEAVARYAADRETLLAAMRTNREDFLASFTANRYVARFRGWLEAVRDESAPPTRGRILLLLRLPPPYGGGEIRAAGMARHVAGNPRYIVSALKNPAGTRANQGRFVPVNIAFAARRILVAWWLIVRHRPAAMFLAIPKNFAAFLWAALVALPAAWTGTRVCGGLAGMRFEFFTSRWKRSVGLAVLRRFHSIRFLGHGIRKAHEEFRLPNPVVFPNGVEAPECAPRSMAMAQEPVLRLIFVGSMEESKGIGVILEAAALARARELSLEWTLVGQWASEAFRDKALRLVAERGLQESVALPGLIVGDARWEYFRRAHILVHPTQLDGQPLTILEAMSQGLAIISSPIGAIPETIVPGRNGVLLDATTPEGLLRAIEDFRSDRAALHRTMVANREDFLARFTAETYRAANCSWLEAVADDRLAEWTPPAPAAPAGDA
jgi:glycosyltransferase involved in cell wall biosynthesis